MGWTDEQVEELKKLWDQGLTTGEIGKALGVSKNAVVGKAHRLKLDSRPSPISAGEKSFSTFFLRGDTRWTSVFVMLFLLSFNNIM